MASGRREHLVNWRELLASHELLCGRSQVYRVTNHIVHAVDVALDHLARYEHHTIDDESTATVASGTSGHRLANCSRLHWRQHKLIGSRLHTKTRRLSLARFVDPACHRMSSENQTFFQSNAPVSLYVRTTFTDPKIVTGEMCLSNNMGL